MSPSALQHLIDEARFLRRAGQAFLAGFRSKTKEKAPEEPDPSPEKGEAKRVGRCPSEQAKNYATGRCEKLHYSLKALRDTAAAAEKVAKTSAAGAGQEHHAKAYEAHDTAARELANAGHHGLAKSHRMKAKFHKTMSRQGTRAKKSTVGGL